jgi:hypothetical protein
MRSTAELDAAVRAGSRRRAARVWSLDTDRQPVTLIEEGVEADVTADMTRTARRAGTLQVGNLDRKYRLEPGSLFAFDWVRVESGLALPAGGVEYVSAITAVVTEPHLDGALLSANLTDLSAVVSEAEFEEPVSFPRGMDVGDYLRALLVLAGWPDDDAWYDFEDAGRELPADMSHDPPDRPWEAAVDAARDQGMRLYFDADGTLRLRAVPVLAETTPVWSFAPGADNTGRITSKALDLARLRNRATARGEGSAGSIVQAEVRDLNPDSPVYNPPPGHADYPGPAGDRPIRVVSAGIVDPDQAEEVARVLLQDNALATETIELVAAAHPGLDEEDVIEARNDDFGVDARYLVASFRLSTRSLAQPIVAKRLRSLV